MLNLICVIYVSCDSIISFVDRCFCATFVTVVLSTKEGNRFLNKIATFLMGSNICSKSHCLCSGVLMISLPLMSVIWDKTDHAYQNISTLLKLFHNASPYFETLTEVDYSKEGNVYLWIYPFCKFEITNFKNVVTFYWTYSLNQTLELF